jgi:hypothetical protein
MDLIQMLHWEAERLRDVYNHWARVANLEGTWIMGTSMTDMKAPCSCCGESGRIKAVATKGKERKIFCHDEEKSCYNYMQGRYFG